MRRAMKREAERNDCDSEEEVLDYKRLRAVNPLSGRMYSEHYYTLQIRRKELPIYQNKRKILEVVMQQPITLLTGETGSGKTTQIPQFLLEAFPDCRVICTQPRRVAAISVATRVAEELDVNIGEEVGYSVRFEERKSDKTRILYVTEGMLIKQLMMDPMLSSCTILVVDEAHERTCDTDIICGMAKRLITRRPGFRVLVMSATLDQSRMARFFKVDIVKVPGRLFNVLTYYSEGPLQDYRQSAVDYAVNIHRSEPPGDILVFLTGEGEIDRAVTQCEDQINAMLRDESLAGRIMNARVFPLYSQLAMNEQKQIFQKLPSGTRKIIFSTNIAETSITIDGIVFVVDAGFVKQKIYDVEHGVNSLVRTATSQSSADQRKGRAGRTCEGKCFRLYESHQFAALEPQNYPEVLRSELTDFVLTLLSLGVTNPVSFEYIDAPAPKSVMDALLRLSHYEAVDDELRITQLGKKISEIPLDVAKSRMLLLSGAHGCSNEIAAITAVLSAGRVLFRPHRNSERADAAHEKFRDTSGDHLTLLRAFHEFVRNQSSAEFCFTNYIQLRNMQQAQRIYMQLMQMLSRLGVPERSTYDTTTRRIDTYKVRRALLEGCFQNVAYLPQAGKQYVTVYTQQPCCMPEHCSISGKPRWVMFDSLECREQTIMSTVTIVEPMWFQMVSPSYFNPNEIKDAEIALAIKNASAAPIGHSLPDYEAI